MIIIYEFYKETKLVDRVKHICDAEDYCVDSNRVKRRYANFKRADFNIEDKPRIHSTVDVEIPRIFPTEESERR